MIDLYDQMKAAEEAFKEYLSQTFGEVGDSLGDAIVTAFEDGSNAMENWAESFNNVLKNLGKQLMQTFFFQKHFDKLEEDLTDIYDKYGDSTNQYILSQKITELFGGFFGQMEGVAQDAADWYEKFMTQAGNYGFDLNGDPSREGSSKGIAQASQDSVDELNGRITVMQSHTYKLSENSDVVRTNTTMLVASNEKMLLVLQGIHDNTESAADSLESMRTDLNMVKGVLYDFKLHGINLNR